MSIKWEKKWVAIVFLGTFGVMALGGVHWVMVAKYPSLQQCKLGEFGNDVFSVVVERPVAAHVALLAVHPSQDFSDAFESKFPLEGIHLKVVDNATGEIVFDKTVEKHEAVPCNWIESGKYNACILAETPFTFPSSDAAGRIYTIEINANGECEPFEVWMSYLQARPVRECVLPSIIGAPKFLFHFLKEVFR
jgi:hypothetical protein